MSHIFISYNNKDAPYVHEFAHVLELEGFDVWLDKKIESGKEWQNVIWSNLDTSDGLIVVLSNNSQSSPPVQKEIDRAQKANKPIYLLLLDGDPYLKGWPQFQKIQYTDVRDGSYPNENFYEQLEIITNRKTERKSTPDELLTASWPKIWVMMFRRPDQYFYARVVNTNKAKSWVIFSWLFLAGMVTGFSNSFSKVIDQFFGGPQLSLWALFVNLVLAPPLGGVFFIIVYILFVGVIHWTSRILGGSNKYSTSLYALSIPILPYTVIEGVLWVFSAFPPISILSSVLNGILGIYFIIIQVLILMAINRFNWQRAAGSIFLPFLLFIILDVCFIIAADLSLRLFDSLGITYP